MTHKGEPLMPDKVKISFKIDSDLNDKVEAILKRYDANRSQLIESMFDIIHLTERIPLSLKDINH